MAAWLVTIATILLLTFVVVNDTLIFSHIYSKATQVTDAFAKHGLALNGVALIFNSPPDFIYFTMLADNSGIVFPRDFSIFCFVSILGLVLLFYLSGKKSASAALKCN